LGKGAKGELLKEESTITIKGGTHVPFSPSFHYLSEVFAPFLKKIGIEIKLAIESYGFYPKGGGKIRADLTPAGDIKSLRVMERGSILRLNGYSGVGNLPLSIAERQRNALAEKIHSEINDLECAIDIELLNISTPGQGTFIFLLSESEHSIAGFTSPGERGKRAEVVGEEAATEFINYYETASALDPHISDQIVLYLSLCKEESIFTTSFITEHLMTNLWVIGLFHEYKYSVEGEIGRTGIVKIN
jgi:RNA 3'-terminal phosphate cyclase (ATP)